MNIIIIGLGVVGNSLAEQLSVQNHRISVIESNAALCQELDDKLDALVVNGAGSEPSNLKNAGIEKADMVIAVTPSDETNLLACHFAMQFGVSKRIARISSREYAHPGSGVNLETLGVTHVVEPEREVVKSILQYIELPGTTQAANFQSDTIYLRGYRISQDMPVASKPLREIDKIPGYLPMRIAGIIRNGSAVLPTGDAKLLPGDEMIAVMSNESWPGFTAILNRQNTNLQKIVIFGDSLTSNHLTATLKTLAERVILVDPNREHGRAVANRLDGVDVLYGDCTDADFLQELHMGNTDFFIAASKDNEDNIMSALLAKAEGAREVIAIHNDVRHVNLFEALGLNHVISPKKITSEKIMEMVHILPIGRLLKLKNTALEVMYFKAERKSSITGKPLRALDKLFKKDIVISAVIHEGRMSIPDGNTIITEGDDVLVLCDQSNAKSAARLFKAGIGL